MNLPSSLIFVICFFPSATLSLILFHLHLPSIVISFQPSPGFTLTSYVALGSTCMLCYSKSAGHPGITPQHVVETGDITTEKNHKTKKNKKRHAWIHGVFLAFVLLHKDCRSAAQTIAAEDSRLQDSSCVV